MTRLLTGLVLGGFWLSLLFLAPFPLFWLVIITACCLVLHEYSTMHLADEKGWIRGCVIAVALLPVAATFCPAPIAPAAGLTAAILATLFLVVICHSHIANPLRLLVGSAFATAYIGFFTAHLAMLWPLEHGRQWLLFLTAVTVAADSGAFYTGSAIGRHKLCPAISPGKTVEGFIGGLGAAVLVALLFVQFSPLSNPVLLVFAVLLAVSGVVGDLTESIIKRACAIKDSGHLLPGHGGLFDRIDALLAAAPVLYYLVRYAID